MQERQIYTFKLAMARCVIRTPQRGVPTEVLANPSPKSWHAGRFAICNWQDFRCCSQSSSGFRLVLSPVAAGLLATWFLVSPVSCKQSRRLRYSRYSSPFPFLESAFALQSLRFFCTVCSQLCATPRPVCRTFHDHCAHPPLR